MVLSHGFTLSGPAESSIAQPMHPQACPSSQCYRQKPRSAAWPACSHACRPVRQPGHFWKWQQRRGSFIKHPVYLLPATQARERCVTRSGPGPCFGLSPLSRVLCLRTCRFTLVTVSQHSIGIAQRAPRLQCRIGTIHTHANGFV